MPRFYDRKSRKQFQHPLPPPVALTALPRISDHRIIKSPFPLRMLRPGSAKRRKYRIFPITFLRLHVRIFRGARIRPVKGFAKRHRTPGSGLASFRRVPRRFNRPKKTPYQIMRGHWHRAKLPAAPPIIRLIKHRDSRGRPRYPQGNIHRGRMLLLNFPGPGIKYHRHRLIGKPWFRVWVYRGHIWRAPQIPTGEVGPVPVNPCQGPNVRPDEVCPEPARPPECAKEK
jgi:hypothetical protein